MTTERTRPAPGHPGRLTPLPAWDAGPASAALGARVQTLTAPRRCGTCRGTGRVIDQRWRCLDCGGQGWV